MTVIAYRSGVLATDSSSTILITNSPDYSQSMCKLYIEPDRQRFAIALAGFSPVKDNIEQKLLGLSQTLELYYDQGKLLETLPYETMILMTRHHVWYAVAGTAENVAPDDTVTLGIDDVLVRTLIHEGLGAADALKRAVPMSPYLRGPILMVRQDQLHSFLEE